MSFPSTRYMGSKQALLTEIMKELQNLDFHSVLDAFSGSACVAYALKRAGKRVVANDFLHFAYHWARATVENPGVELDAKDLDMLLDKNPSSGTFIRKTFSGLYFGERDCEFLDNTRANIELLDDEMKKSIALAALARACMKGRPRGIFSFVGRKSWDNRRDLKISLSNQFVDAVRLFNSCVFDNGEHNKATCLDVFSTETFGIDLVYIDTPYLSPHSDSDYTRRYHFVEGLCKYWKGVEIQEHTITKKIKSYPTAFSSVGKAESAFSRLFEHFQDCKLVVSYSSNCVPNRDDMISILSNYKRKVKVIEMPHRYSFGNHGHKIDDNNNRVTEYLFIAE